MLYATALRQVNGEHAVRRWLEENPQQDCAVIAIGKAAPAMMKGAWHELGDRLQSGLVITRKGYADPSFSSSTQLLQIESAHPVPDESSLIAGEELLDFVRQQPPGLPLLFMISGGTSSLVEVLQPGITLGDLQRLNHWLIGADMDIQSMNQLRRRVSRIKGGGLGDRLEGRKVQVLLISDVPGDDPEIIGSGLLCAPKASGELPELPGWVANLVHHDSARKCPDFPHFVIAGSVDAVAAAAAGAVALGYPVQSGFPVLQGNAEEQGVRFARLLREAKVGVYVMGGETTMKLPKNPGRGGRSQHLALIAAREIAGRKDLFILAAGTDGSDGPGDDAGALIDGTTWERARQHGLDSRRALSEADSGTILEATGDLISTGSTGTNVMDLLIGLRLPR
jgi:hydroxypyruvate reductase